MYIQPCWLDEQLRGTRTRICLCAHSFRVMEINCVAICAACAAAVHLIISECFMGMSRDEDVEKDRDCILEQSHFTGEQLDAQQLTEVLHEIICYL